MIDNKLKNRDKNCEFICGTRRTLHQSILKYQTFSASMLLPFHWSVERQTFFPKRVFPGPFARLATYMPFCIIFQPFYIFQLSVSFLKFMWQKKRNKICLSSLTIYNTVTFTFIWRTKKKHNVLTKYYTLQPQGYVRSHKS